MAKKDEGKRGPRGPAGPSGARGARGQRGERGAQGERGRKYPQVLGPNSDPQHLIKALDTQVEGIYRELGVQMNRMTRLQRQLEEVRDAIKRLSGHQLAPR